MGDYKHNVFTKLQPFCFHHRPFLCHSLYILIYLKCKAVLDIYFCVFIYPGQTFVHHDSVLL